MQTQITVISPAKINRFLHIIGQRPDGYHNLQTLFQFLDFGDRLQFKLLPNPCIRLHAPNIDCELPQNLIFKAAYLLQEKYTPHVGIEITVNKNIPMGSGLGGGSSNAATTLLVLNHLWELNLSKNELLNLSISLGADVPIFIHGHSAIAEGIGEKLTSVEPDESWVLVTVPDCHVPTAKIFQHNDLTRNSPAFRIEALKGLLKDERFESKVRNDFEPLVRRCYLAIDQCFEFLNQHCSAKLTGSGSAMFALFDKKSQAELVLSQIPPSTQAFIARGVNQSPLHAQLGNIGFC